MTAEQKLAQKRITLLQLAKRLGNVSEACQFHSISRSQFYEYKRAFQEQGFQGLVDRPPIPQSFPDETPWSILFGARCRPPISFSYRASS